MQRDLAFAHQNITDRVRQAADEREKLNDSLKSLAEYKPGDQVFVFAPPKSTDGNSGKLMSPYHGPYTVVRQTSRVTYSLRNNHTHKKTSAHVTLMKPAAQRPSHLVPAADAPAPAPAAPGDLVFSGQEPQGVSRRTRAQRASRLQLQHVAPTPTAAIDMEQKHSPAQSSLSPIDPAAEAAVDDTDDEDEDSSPPDEELEEGEVPLEIAKQLFPTQHM